MEASLFSILLDETTDVSHIKQASFVVCYVTSVGRYTTGQPTWCVSGPYKGLQSRIQKQNEKALYVHVHCLNSVIEESAKSSIHFVDFFLVAEEL